MDGSTNVRDAPPAVLGATRKIDCETSHTPMYYLCAITGGDTSPDDGGFASPSNNSSKAFSAYRVGLRRTQLYSAPHQGEDTKLTRPS